MKCVVSLFVLFVCVQCVAGGLMKSNKQLKESAVVVSATPGELRSFEVDWLPAQHPRFINLTGVDFKANASHADASVVQFIMNTFNETTLTFTYIAENANVKGNETDVNVGAFEFVLRSYVVYEYAERNNVPGFQNGTTDVLTGFYDLSHPELQWKDLDIESMNVTLNGTDYSVFFVTAQTLDEVFTIRFIVAGTNVEVEGKTITTSTCKIDVGIKWFTDKHVAANWTTGPSPASVVPQARVGFVGVFIAAAESFSANSSNPLNNTDPTITFQAADVVGFFSYEPSADVEVNGEVAAAAVHASITDAGSANSISGQYSAEYIVRIMWFSFDGIRPSEVSWDPEFGAAKLATPTTPTVPSASSSSGAAASSTSTTASSASYIMPSALFAIACVFFAMF